jgi:3-ketoacyl-CoA synthase
MQKDDEVGKLGMRIGRDLMQTAGKALRINITTLGPLVLPLSEKLIYAGNLVARKARTPASARPQ